MRASQLDAARLDDELTAMLKEHFMRIFGLFQPVCHPFSMHDLLCLHALNLTHQQLVRLRKQMPECHVCPAADYISPTA